jgi:hypothetical protein
VKLYESFFELEAFWAKAADIIDGSVTEGEDGLPMSQDDALNWLEQCLQRIEAEHSEKVLRIGCFIKNLRVDAEALKAEKTRLAKRQQGVERTIEHLTRYLRDFSEPGRKYESPQCTIGWRKSEAVLVSVSPQKLPEQFRRVKVEADLNAIKAALKEGDAIEGAVLEQRQSIQIR